ncbi:right-handed parallel beta-helix repeat-containing protein [Marinobacter sp. F4206]|uniref:right-handed parallel beta-helix repeat-containing protein n=1 Tax=Marinobacter sp. F4206 TaxID=2861777 RepID=UPI001C5E3F9E|nr:right-handed parallel beta-helix repeat-containing protein [Marinobacter sp. F4206]MBW4934364.1 hypothetical protein [Marinobacter sp. F4206]
MNINQSLLVATITGLMALPVSAQLFEVSTNDEFQSALTAAASNGQDDTIVLSPALYVPESPGQPFTYDSTQSYDLRIEAEIPGEVILDGQSLGEILYLSGDASADTASISIKGIRFQNGKVGAAGRRGGGLTVLNADMLLDRSEFVDNFSDKPNSGSAVFLSGGSFAINASKFVGNVSDACGAVYSEGALDGSVTGSEFRSNRARRGGAICAYSGRLTISGSEFRNNEASENGGAIAGAAIELKSSVVSDNTATRLSIVSASREFHAENSLFERNQVPDGTDSGMVRCEQACSVVNSVFERNTGAPAIKMQSGNADNLVIANSLFLGGNASAFAFANADARATILNNFISLSLLPLPESQINQQDNILNQPDPALGPDYSPLEGSDLIDAGTSQAQLVALAEMDYLGNPRVAGANVDIGWVEFGSSPTAPVISNLALETAGASNLDSLSFSFNVELAEGRSVVLTELWTDEEPDYQAIPAEGGVFGGVVFVNGGAHQIRIRVTDSRGERSEALYSFTLNSLSTEGVALRVEEEIRAACAEDMEYCGIDVESFVAQAIEEAKTSCKNDPSSCQIEAGSFDGGLISSMTPGDWNLYGTGRDITDLATVFADARVVWFHNRGTWEAFSTQPDVIRILNANGIPMISKIPAGRGFWVKK